LSADWRPHALCAGLDPDLFHPSRGVIATDEPEGPPIEDVFCAFCPVRLQCLNHAMREGHGIWGGWRAEVRAWVRRSARPCPWCSVPIPRYRPIMFCGAECEAAAVEACGEEAERLEKVLAEMAEMARLAIAQAKGRRQEPAEGAPRQGALW
jgi:Transcription factor WhiB